MYPASVYIILFGLSLAPFVDLLPGSQGRVKIYKDKAGTYYLTQFFLLKRKERKISWSFFGFHDSMELGFRDWNGYDIIKKNRADITGYSYFTWS